MLSTLQNQAGEHKLKGLPHISGSFATDIGSYSDCPKGSCYQGVGTKFLGRPDDICTGRLPDGPRA